MTSVPIGALSGALPVIVRGHLTWFWVGGRGFWILDAIVD